MSGRLGTSLAEPHPPTRKSSTVRNTIWPPSVCINLYLYCNTICVCVALIFSRPTEAVKDPTRIKTDDSTSDSGTTINITTLLRLYIVEDEHTHLIANSWRSSSNLLKGLSPHINNSSNARRSEQDDINSNSLTVSELGNRQKSSKYLHYKCCYLLIIITY